MLGDRRFWIRLAVAGWLASGAAFGPAQAIVMRHDVEEQAFLDLGSRFPATAKLKRKGSGPATGAEGTLIAPRWILTAGHVAAGMQPGDLAIVDGREHAMERIVIHPRWGTDADMKVDIALIRLVDPVTGVRPAAIYKGTEEEALGVTFVGRGGDGSGLTGPRAEDGRVRGATNRIEKVGESWLRFRFDAPGDATVTALEGISGPGDSGGPAYQEREGRLFVVGVSSGQDSRPSGGKEGHYKVLEYYTRVSHFSSWILETMEGGGNGARPGERATGDQ